GRSAGGGGVGRCRDRTGIDAARGGRDHPPSATVGSKPRQGSVRLRGLARISFVSLRPAHPRWLRERTTNSPTTPESSAIGAQPATGAGTRRPYPSDAATPESSRYPIAWNAASTSACAGVQKGGPEVATRRPSAGSTSTASGDASFWWRSTRYAVA